MGNAVRCKGISRSRLLAVALPAEGAVLVSAVLLARFFDTALFPLCSSCLRDTAAGVAGTVPLLLLFRFILSEKSRTLPGFRSIRHTVIYDVRRIFACAGWIDLLVLSLLAGLSEELLFRGVVQARFGITAGSILFGLCHFITPAYVIVTVIAGFYFGLLYHAAGSLLVPVLVHGLYDFAALVYLRYFVSEGEENCCNDDRDVV